MKLPPTTANSSVRPSRLPGRTPGFTVETGTGIQPAVGADFLDCMRLYLTQAGRLATYNACADNERSRTGWIQCATQQPGASPGEHLVIGLIYGQCAEQHPVQAP